MVSTMRRAAAVGVSPNRITLLRDANGDGVAETRDAFLEGLSQPFGMALLGDTFYVGNTDGVARLSLHVGRDSHHRAGTQAGALQARRALDAQPAAESDGRKLFVGVGSFSNIGERGLDIEEGRA
jgi:glucose/arabinose dehydrogenase